MKQEEIMGLSQALNAKEKDKDDLIIYIYY